MKKLAFAMLTTLSLTVAAQSTYVQPYMKNNGTLVEGHYRNQPNGTKLDNYSSQGNVNPYTGQAGTVNPYAQQQPYVQPSSQYLHQQKCGYTQSGQYRCN